MDDEQLIKNIENDKKNPANKDDLISFIKRTLEEIEEIKHYYKKLHEGTDEEESIIKQIEASLDKINRAHKELFEADEKGEIKTQELNKKIEEIKQYHKELLEGDEAIKADVKDSQTKITEFYNFLFDAENEEKKNNEDKTKESIEKITDFHNRITTELEAEVDRLYKAMTQKYSDLFNSEEGEKSKIVELEENMSKISKFDENLEKKIKPNLDKKQKYLDDLQIDIDKKSKDVNSLLEAATGGAIAEGYKQSMEIYSKRFPIKYDETKKEKKKVIRWLKYCYIFAHNNFLRHLSEIVNYLIFFLPLVAICLIFIEPEWIRNYLKISPEKVTFTGGEFIFFKTFVSLPLLWIAWFGQTNISKRKRLFEEYNHKLRVSQMYLMFNGGKDKEYSLSKEHKENLAGTLLGAIDYNPAEHLGKGETMLDKLLEKFHLAGLYKKLIKEVEEEINPLKIDKK